MHKSKALELLGGTIATAAEAVGISYQAVNQWPDELPPRIEDRVLAAYARKHFPKELHGTDGIATPKSDIDEIPPKDDINQIVKEASAPLTADPKLRDELAKSEQAGLIKQPTTAKRKTAERDNRMSHFCTPITSQSDTDRNRAIQGRSNLARSE